MLTEATALTFTNLLAGFDESTNEHSAARRVLVNYYLSPEYRDGPSEGCPTAGFVGTLAREKTEPEMREAYTDGVQGSPSGCPRRTTMASRASAPSSAIGLGREQDRARTSVLDTLD